MTKCFFIFGALAKRSLIRERAAAGPHPGPQGRRLADQHSTVNDVAKKLNLALSVLCRHLPGG